jgi:hypothetical protein
MPTDPGFGADREPADMSGQYNTVLSPDDEARYQAWGKQQAAQIGRNPAADTYDYDMRGFWQSGEPVAANGHSGDAYKKPNHPTFSNQSRYQGADGATGGTWSGGQDGRPWGFTPSTTNLQNRGVAGMERYFDQSEKGNYLMLPTEHAFGGSIRRASGGYSPNNPQISREDDAEVLSHGRRQSRDLDINLTPTPAIRAPISDIPTRPDPSWLPGPIPTDGAGVPQQRRMRSGGFARRDDGGSTPLPTQSTALQAPAAQQQMGYFQGMSQEQLQEQALRLRGTAQGQLAQRVLQQKRIMPQPVAQPAAPTAAPAPPDQSSGPMPYALGGTLEAKGGAHLPERGISSGATPPSPGGFLHTAGPGRSDNLNIHPHADSYVLPADVVSGMGEGNSLAGAKALETTFNGSTGPGGIPMPTATHTGHRMGAPRLGAGGFGHGMPHAKGGETNDNDADDKPQTVPIQAAGGEYVVTPEQVRALGHGDVDRGHKILDAFVLHVRKRTVGEMQKLKGPVKS